jgi:hypothetical protein
MSLKLTTSHLNPSCGIRILRKSIFVALMVWQASFQGWSNYALHFEHNDKISQVEQMAGGSYKYINGIIVISHIMY